MNLETILLIAPVILISLTFHEYAHGKMSDLLGDPTPRMMGRLTLNPIAHLDLLGTVVFLSTQRIGWAKPVPVNPVHYKDRRRGMLYVGLAGPMANLLLALLATGLLYAWKWSDPQLGYKIYYNQLGAIGDYLLNILFLLVQANIGLAVFNLLPFPPLDGSRVLAGIIPPKYANYLDYLEGQFGMIIVLFLAMTGMLGRIIAPIIEFVKNLLFIGL